MKNATRYEDFLHMYFNHFNHYGENSPIFEQFNKPLFIKIFLMIRHFFAFIFSDVINQSLDTLKNKVAYYAISKNTLNALSFLENEPDSILVYSSLKLNVPDCTKRQLTNKWRYTFNYFSILFHFYKRNKKFTLAYFDLIYYSIGYYETFKKTLTSEKPKLMVFSNDHNYDSRALLMACTELNIKTVYVQHASVTPLFPPLSFDLNLLEGDDSLNKYKQCGSISGKTQFVGMPRFDKYFHLIKPEQRTVATIGVAFNMIDHLDSVYKILEYLSTQTNYSITYRPHPREARNLERFRELKRIKKSSDSETAFDFLKKQDVLIGGSSSILLEACLLNVIPIYYHFESAFNDVYGFAQNGLAHTLNQISDLDEILNEYKKTINVRAKAKYYNATIDTIDDGKSSILALKLIKQFVNE